MTRRSPLTLPGGPLGLGDKLVQGRRWVVEAGLLEQLGVVEQVLGAVEQRHAVQLAVVRHRAERRRRHVLLDRIGDAAGQVIHPASRGEARRPHRIHLHHVEVAAALHRCMDLIQALVVLHNGLIDLDAGGVREVFDQRRAHVGHVRPEQIDHLFAAGCRAAATRTQQTACQGCTAGGPYERRKVRRLRGLRCVTAPMVSAPVRSMRGSMRFGVNHLSGGQSDRL